MNLYEMETLRSLSKLLEKIERVHQAVKRNDYLKRFLIAATNSQCYVFTPIMIQ